MKKLSKKLLALLLVFAMLIPTGSLMVTTSAEDENDGIVEFNGHYYKVFDEKMLWTEAKAYCESIGGHLATITSDEENSFVSSLLDNDYYFLGGSDAGHEGIWEWVTGEEWDFSTWAPGEPNNSNNPSREQNILAIYGKKGAKPGLWDDSWNEANYFICEWDSEGDVGSGGSGNSNPSTPGISENLCLIITVDKGGYVSDFNVKYRGPIIFGIEINLFDIQNTYIPDGEIIIISMDDIFKDLLGNGSDITKDILLHGEFIFEGGENISYSWELDYAEVGDSEGDVGAEENNHQWDFDEEKTALACLHCDKIYYLSANKNFKFGRDNFSFEHNEVGSYDISFIGNQYVIPALKLDILALGVNLIKRGNNYLENKKDGKGNGTWRGSCYGMACMDASFLSTLNTADYGSSSVYGLSLGTKLKDSINIMMYSQASTLNLGSNWGNNYKAAVSAAKSLSSSSYLPVLNYTGHAVNIIGILPDDFDSNYYVLVTYDCNKVEPQFILITKEYDKAYLGELDLNNSKYPIKLTREEVEILGVKTNSNNNIDFWAPGLRTSPLYSPLRTRSINTPVNYSSDEDIENESDDYIKFLLASDDELVVTADDNSYFVYNNEEIIETNIEEIYYEYLSDFGVTKVVIPRTAASYKIESNNQYYANVGYDEKVAVYYCENGGVSTFETDGIASVDTSNTQSYSEMACYKYDIIADSDAVGVMLSNSSSDTKIDFSKNTPFIETSNGEQLNVKIQNDDDELSVKEIALENSDNIENFTLKAENGDIVLDGSCNTHTYSSAVKNEPTCTDKGYTIYTCDCGFTYESDFVDALGHSDANHDGICDACSEDFTKGCSCNCHGNAFMQFLHKIVTFLRKLFGMKQYQYCNCGKAHW